jgi:hypothetical protein
VKRAEVERGVVDEALAQGGGHEALQIAERV